MKFITLTILTVFSFIPFIYGQSTFGNNGNDAVITWENDIHNFGKIKQNKPVSIKYKFKNDGLKPIIITNVESSCGCTVPSYPKKPIPPMSEGVITATYDAKKIGVFSKSISVTTNASEKPKVLILKGEVIP